MEQYVVVESVSKRDFEELINNLLDEGYMLVGGVAVMHDGDEDAYFQAMAKPKLKLETPHA